MISVIVPVYNTGKYLKKCIDSILTQTYPELEIILVDDGSTDGSPSICDEYAEDDPRVKVIHQENKGLSAARNAGMRAANGEYLTFVDSDDYIEADTYEKVMDAFSLHHPDLVFFREKEVDLSGKTIRINGKTPTNTVLRGTQKDALDLVIGCLVNGVCDKVFPKSTIDGLFFEEGRMYGEDFWFNLHMLPKVETMACVDSIQYSYVSNQDSVTHASFNSRTFDQMYFKDKVAAYVQQQFPDYARICRKRAYLSRLYVCRPIIRERLERNYAKELAEIRRYLKDGYKDYIGLLTVKEKTEYRLFMFGGFPYRLFLATVTRAHQ